MAAPVVDLTIARGKTFEYSFLYADDTLVYRPITAMPSKAPVRLTVPAHGVPDGWPVDVRGATPSELNTVDGAEPRFARVVDADTLEFNALDGSGFRAFSAGGNVIYRKPADLTGWSARAAVRDKPGGVLLLRWDSNPLSGAEGLIVLDAARAAFVLQLGAVVTAALPWSTGVWELEAVDPQGRVYGVVGISRVNVTNEVVT